ncbi:MAG: extracellular solute-binding protein [Armatimonadetes bacterium]|nr:extracellular solute-binding protein [Armatimonadota bacterium]MDE2207931.1 extracellular solute-binding protein [Armatimonadota bacterium]
MSKSRLIGVVAATATVFVAGCHSGGGSGSSSSAGGTTLHIAWAQWKPSDYLQTVANEYTKQTGVKVVVDQIPWSQYQDKITTAWSAHSSAYDLIVGDSQWLGLGATQGHYVDLTDWAKTHVDMAGMSPAALSKYGEYPPGSGKYYGMPCESDGIGFAYRKDLFENPAEKAAFLAKYHYPLAPPTTWAQFRDIAEFFTRPQQKLYGCSLFYSKEYDAVTMGFDQVLWCYGGHLKDANGVVQGVINSPTAVNALKFYAQDLKKFTPPGSSTYYFNEDLEAFASGQTAMVEDWFSFMPGFTDPNGKNKNYLSKTGYFISPAGPGGHYIQLGGQGLSISSYSNQIPEAEKFLEWFEKPEQQQKWAQLGGLTATLKVLNSPAFDTYAPYNKVFSESQKYFRDFYNNPAYAALLDSCQKHWNAVASGLETPQQSLDAVAQEHTQILKSAGLLK